MIFFNKKTLLNNQRHVRIYHLIYFIVPDNHHMRFAILVQSALQQCTAFCQFLSGGFSTDTVVNLSCTFFQEQESGILQRILLDFTS